MASLTFEGGLNEQDISLVNSSECIEGYNFELGSRDTHFRPRKSFDLKGTATNAGDIRGFLQLIPNTGAASTTLVQSDDVVYEWDGASTFTSRGTVNATSQLRYSQWTLGNYLVITDLQKLTQLKTWDGTTFANMTTGLGSTTFAKYSIEHLNRIWLFNVKSGTDTPHLLVASAYEDPTSFDTAKAAKDATFTTGLEAFYMTTPDLRPINGVALFFGVLIISTEGGTIWKLTGSDSTDFAWVPLYAKSNAIGTETVAHIGNDVVYMRTGGNIESLSSTDRFGDVEADDLSRFIRDTTDGLSNSITVYDQKRQKVYFFADSNKLLVLYKNMMETQLSPWSVYKTNHASSFSTNAAAYLRDPGSTTEWHVYFGDSTGGIYILDGTSNADPSSTNIDVNRKSMFFEDIGIDPQNQVVRGRVYYRRTADVDLLMDLEWADDYTIPRCTVPLDGPSLADDAVYFGGTVYFNGAYYFNKGFEFSLRTSTKGFSSVGRGPGFNLSLTVQSQDDFDVQKIEV